MESSGHWNPDALPPEISAAFADLRSGSGCPEPALIRAAQSDVLPAELGSSVRRHLEHCPICQSLARDLELLEESALDAGQVQRVWNRVQAAVDADPVLPRTNPWKSWLRPWPLVAVTVAIAIAVLAPGLFRHRPEQSARGPVVPAPPNATLTLEKPPVILPASALMVWRGAPEGDRRQWTELQAALLPYQAGDYASAAAQLRRVATSYPRLAEAWFYLGVSELFLTENSRAADDLEAGRKLNPPALRAELDWYTAIADERTGRIAQRQILLEALCRGSGKYSAAACRAIPK